MLVVCVASRDVDMWFNDGGMDARGSLSNIYYYTPDFIFLNLPSEDQTQSSLTIPIIIGFVVLLLAAAAAVVGVLLYKKRNGEWIKLSGRTET